MKTANLGDVGQFIAGTGFPKKFQGHKTGKYPFAKVGDISKCVRAGFRSLNDADNWIDDSVAKALKARIIPKNSILFAKIGEAIRQNFRASAGREVIIDNNAMAYVPTANELDASYAFHFLSKIDLYTLTSKTAVPSIRKSDLETIKIPLPPLPEQKRIASILDKADALRTKRKQAIAKLDELLQSVFLDMFGDPVTNPKGWKILKVGEILQRKSANGAYYPKEVYVNEGGVLMVHMSDAFYGTVRMRTLKRVNAQESDIEKYGLDPNDILISRRSLNYEGAAKPCLIPKIDEPMIFESSLIRITPDPKKVLPLYLYTFLNEPRARSKYLMKFVTRSTISGISQSNLLKVKVLVPPLELQGAFESFVKGFDVKLLALKNQQSKLDTLFASLQQRAFKGEL